MGRANLQALSSQNIVAMCDVDWNFGRLAFRDIDNQITNANKRATEATDPCRKRTCAAGDQDWQALQHRSQEQALHRLPRNGGETEEH